MYKLKYLKYKKKYLNLKNNLKGGNNNLLQDLIYAIKANNIDDVQTLINNNPNVVNQTNDDGKTPLFTAVEKFDIDMIQLLINLGSDIYKTDNNNNTIFHILFLKLAQFFFKIDNNNFNEQQLTQEINNKILSVVQIINIFKQKDPSFNFNKKKNSSNKNILNFATFAITQDKQLKKNNLTQEDVNKFTVRLNSYDFIIRSFIFDNESIKDEEGSDNQPGLSTQSFLNDTGYIGNFIDKIFKEKLNQKLTRQRR
jgi:ankyrin repeat protein